MARYNLVSPLNLLSDFDRHFQGIFPATQREENQDWRPFTQMKEEENHYHLSLDLPGVKQENLNVQLDGDVLKIEGERKSRFKNDNSEYQTIAQFSRSFKLPRNANGGELQAHLDEGILDIVIPKYRDAEKSGRSIEVKSGKNPLI